MLQEKMDVLLETVNYCNLRCPACPWHNTMTREKRKLSPDEFSTIFEHIYPYTKSICFYVMGEPLLNENLFGYIKTAHDAGVHTGISTNGMLLGEHIDDIFNSGLDFIQVALDGLDAQTHESYRVGSNFNAIVSGLRQMVIEREKRNCKRPEIQIQTLISRENENRLMEFQTFADELGVGFSAKKMMFGKTEDVIRRNREVFEPTQMIYRRLDNPDLQYYKDMEICPQTKNLTILCNGDVVPCCYDYDGREILGNLIRQTLPEILQGDVKRAFDTKRNLGMAKLCASCDMAMERKKQLPLAVLFDYGRTLVIMPDIDIRRGIAYLLTSLGVKSDPETVEQYYEEREKFVAQRCPDKKRRMIYPEKTVMEYLFGKFSIHTKKEYIELEKIFSEGCSLGQPTEGSTELLNMLRSLGISTGIVTNNRYSVETVRWKLKKLFPDHEFDIIISSAEAGYHKPDKRIFEQALQELQTEPNKVWFAGDSIEDDVKGANQVGMEAFWYVKHAKVDATKINRREDCRVIREWNEMKSILLDCTEKNGKEK